MVRFVLDDDKVYKVVAESDDAIWVIDYDNPCAPKMVKQDGLVNLEEIPVPDDYMQESVVSRAIYDTAKKRLGILSAILSDNAYITNAALRQRAIAKIAQDARVSQKTLKRWYYSYLAYGERGLCPASKIKKSKTLPQEHEKKIASALSKYYYSPKKRSLKTTYEMMLLKYYRNEQRIIVPDHPTYGQFLYYYRKNRDVVRKLISREGIGEYQKNARPLLGKGDAGITTIGYFEIDATVADIYVVSRFDRKPIGRPVLYVAIDIASRMIAGIYVGFEESAEAVLTCLANAACDKVDFCKEHGISITADMWPSKGLPGTIYTDRGSDFASFRVKELCSTFNMEITTLPPYRPDLKGYVERAIGCIQERYKPLLRGKGVVDKTSLERSQPDYAQQAILDIEEYTKVVIECVLYYNDSHVQKKYERSQMMIEQGVPPIASELWKFYNAQTKTNIIYADDELLQMLLLPRKKARITRYGVENDGIYYYSDELKMEFVRAGINGAKQVDIAFMPNDNSFIYLVDNGLYHKLMTLANLEQVYACNYFVPTNTLGVELLSRTVTLTRSDLNSMIEMWLSEMTERYTTVSSREYVEAYIEDQEDKTLIFPIIELEELVFQRANKERYHIVCERGTQDGISRVMGKKLIDFKDMNNTPMPAHKYDDYGIRRDGINPLTHSGYWEEEQ